MYNSDKKIDVLSLITKNSTKKLKQIFNVFNNTFIKVFIFDKLKDLKKIK
jgi:hypothetical protein